jgi:hypothetical protein
MQSETTSEIAKALNVCKHGKPIDKIGLPNCKECYVRPKGKDMLLINALK